MRRHMSPQSLNPCSTVTFEPATSKYFVSFAEVRIETTVTDRAAKINEWVRDVLSLYQGKQTVVGLDIEWRPNRFSNVTNKTATLQLCIDTKCLIIQLFYLDHIPDSLRVEFLSNPNFIFAGVEVWNDVVKLRNDYGLMVANSKDIRDHAMRVWPMNWFSRPGLKKLAMDLLGLDMKKPPHVCRSNWEVRVLSLEQVEYACIDAYASYRIGNKLLFEN